MAIVSERAPESKEVDRANLAIDEVYGGEKAQSRVITAEGQEIRYTVCNRTEGRIIVGVGGLFVGLISTGLGELNGYFLLQHCTCSTVPSGRTFESVRHDRRRCPFPRTPVI